MRRLSQSLSAAIWLGQGRLVYSQESVVEHRRGRESSGTRAARVLA